MKHMISADLEGINSQSITESQKLTATTILAQLKDKREQIAEFYTALQQNSRMRES